MGTRRLKILTLTPGVVSAENWKQELGFQNDEKMDEMHIFFSRPLSGLEFAGIQAAIERAIR